VPVNPVEDAFRPSNWLRNPNIQSILPSLGLRRPAVRRDCAALLRASEETLLECGDGVRLLGYFSKSPRAAAAAGGAQLAVILHGWEGSANSMYVLSLGQCLFDLGFDVFRLNLRDHGDSHHLNRGIFHSCRLPEVVGAVRRLIQLFPRHRRCFAGFSLGGNFALRVGAALGVEDDSLARIVAISPVLDPENTLAALEGGLALYRRYFIKKWLRSLAAKQAAWPSEYDFSRLSHRTSLTGMTEQLVLDHTEYPSLSNYLRGYAITGDALHGLRIPSRIVASQDDPIIPAADLRNLASISALSITLTTHGGHCGFRERLFGDDWLHRQILAGFA
jgi:predicted alpha/beta-fold hydrolase